jgi:hypothetical protein
LYGNKYNSIDRWIKKLRALPSPKMDDPKSIMTYRMELSNGLALLLGAYSHLQSPIIPEDIIEKFPLHL